MSDKLIIIAAGGTGGHLYPGIALARELKSKGFDPVFMVRSNDTGRGALDKEGLKYFEIPSMGLPRAFSLKLLIFPFIFAAGFFKAFSLLRKARPFAVAGMGSYISFPAVICAYLLNIPSVIHEQNALPGAANKILSRFADTLALSFESSKKYFPGRRTVVTGNPVRPELFQHSSAGTHERMGVSEDRFTVLVFGGSQGAAKINKTVIDSFEYLGDLKDKIQFLIISGPKDYQLTLKECQEKNIPGKVVDYANSMEDAYAVSDLIISRSGATTVAELRILNKHAVLIPFPFATANHQEFNARALEQEGIAEVILEKDLTPRLLAGTVAGAFKNIGRKEQACNVPPVFPQELLAAEVIKFIL